MLAALLCTLLFSLSAVTARRTTKYLGGTEANFTRLIIAPLVLSAIAFLFFADGAKHFDTGIFWLLFASGAIGFGLGDIALFQSLQRIGSRLTVLIVHCVSVPLAVTCEYALYKFGLLEANALITFPQIIWGRVGRLPSHINSMTTARGTDTQWTISTVRREPMRCSD